MKKEQLRKIILEAIQETLNEAMGDKEAKVSGRKKSGSYDPTSKYAGKGEKAGAKKTTSKARRALGKKASKEVDEGCGEKHPKKSMNEEDNGCDVCDGKGNTYVTGPDGEREKDTCDACAKKDKEVKKVDESSKGKIKTVINPHHEAFERGDKIQILADESGVAEVYHEEDDLKSGSMRIDGYGDATLSATILKISRAKDSLDHPPQKALIRIDGIDESAIREEEVAEALRKRHKMKMNESKDTKEKKTEIKEEKTFEEKFDEDRFVPAYRSMFTKRKEELGDELMKRWVKKGK